MPGAGLRRGIYAHGWFPTCCKNALRIRKYTQFLRDFQVCLEKYGTHTSIWAKV